MESMPKYFHAKFNFPCEIAQTWHVLKITSDEYNLVKLSYLYSPVYANILLKTRSTKHVYLFLLFSR